MLLAKNTPASKIIVWAPRYKDRKVLIAKYKVGNHNEIIFEKAKHLLDMKFYMSGQQITSYPLEDNGKIACYAVPMDDLFRLERV